MRSGRLCDIPSRRGLATLVAWGTVPWWPWWSWARRRRCRRGPAGIMTDVEPAGTLIGAGGTVTGGLSAGGGGS
jgi:hypothetical protein